MFLKKIVFCAKQKTVICFILAGLILSIPLTAVYGASTPSAWASQEINDAISLGLVTENAAADYTKNLTREEFCELIVLMTEKLLGETLTAAPAPFGDTDSTAVSKAYGYGIVSGISENIFSPGAPITREQMVALTVRALRKIENEKNAVILSNNGSLPDMEDIGHISPWARETLATGFTSGLIVGSNNKLFPKNNITSQECVLIITRSFHLAQNNLKGNSGNGTLNTANPNTENNNTNAVSKTEADAILLDAYNKLNITYASGDSASSVTKNLTLPTTADGGVTIGWTSNNSVLDGSGVLTPSPYQDFTVTLTATLRKEGATTKQKKFSVVVKAGEKAPVITAAISLKGITLGQSKSQVTSAAGSPKRTIGLSSSETWYIYHNGSYKDFYMVGLNNDKVEAIYGIGASLDLKNDGKSITAAEAGKLSNISVNVFKDNINGGSQYALLVKNQQSSVGQNNVKSLNEQEMEYAIYEITNGMRAYMGVEPLAWHDTVAKTIRLHAEDMKKNNYYSHDSVITGDPGNRLAAQNYSYASYGENLYKGQYSPMYAVDGWINSSGHRKTMLDNRYKNMGVGYSGGYCGQLFTIPAGVNNTGEKPDYSITGVVISEENAEMQIGDTLRLKVTSVPSGSPMYNASWTSSNTSRATVDQNGVVTAVGKGTVTIYYNCFGASASCKILVKDGDYPLTGLTLSNNYPDFVKVGSIISYQVNPIPMNTNSNYNLACETSNASVAEIVRQGTNFILTGKSPGRVKVRIYDERGSVSLEFDVEVKEDAPMPSED